MRNILLITAFAIAAMNSGIPATAQVLTGKWSGKSSTSLEFLEGSKVKYCYKQRCTTQDYTGNKDREIKFSWGRSRFTFTKTDNGYEGTFLRVLSARVQIQ